MRRFTILSCAPVDASTKAKLFSAFFAEHGCTYTYDINAKKCMTVTAGKINPASCVVLTYDNEVLHDIFQLCSWFEKSGLVPM